MASDDQDLFLTAALDLLFLLITPGLSQIRRQVQLLEQLCPEPDNPELYSVRLALR